MFLASSTPSSSASKAVESYHRRGTFFDPYIKSERPLADLLNPQVANCMCEDVSRDFLDYLGAMGFLVGGQGSMRAELWKDQDPQIFGFTQNLDLPHTVVSIWPDESLKDHFYSVDWTGSQYGVQAFPYIQSFEC